MTTPMDVKEFKAWFEGFRECIDGTPTPEQFAKIKAKIAQIEGPAPKVTYRHPLAWADIVPKDERIQPMVAR
jgi:hypothetical protein